MFDFPPRQLRCQSRILTRLSDGQRQLIVVDNGRHLFVAAVDDDALDLCRAEGAGQEDRFVICPGNNVDTLVAELAHDRLNTRSFHADASADRVDARIVRMHGDLGALPGLAGDSLDFDDPFVDLGDFDLEQLDEEVRMGTGQNDLRPFGGPKNIHEDRPNRVTLAVSFLSDLLLQRNNGLGSPHVDEDVATADLLNRAGDDLSDAALIVFEDALTLGFPNALHENLLGCLDRVSSEISEREFFFDLSARGGVRIDFLSGTQLYLEARVFHLTVGDDVFFGQDPDTARGLVNFYFDVVARVEALFCRRDETDFKRFDDQIATDILLLRDLSKRLDDFVIHFSSLSFLELKVQIGLCDVIQRK